MFKSITINANSTMGNGFDMGFLAESLFFYEHVILIVDSQALFCLIQDAGIENVLYLVKEKKLSLFVKNEKLITINSPSNLRTASRLSKKTKNYYEKLHKIHVEGKFLIKKNEDYYSIDSLEIEIRKSLSLLYDFKGNKADKLTNGLLDNMEMFFFDENIISEIDDDLSDIDYLKKSLFSFIRLSDIPIKFENIDLLTEKKAGYWHIDYHFKLDSDTKFLFKEYLIVAREAIHISKKFNSEIADGETCLKFIQNKISTIIEKRTENTKSIGLFQEIILNDYRSVGDAIRNKILSVTHFIRLLDDADRFKLWLKDVDMNSNIIAEYYKAVMKPALIDKMAIKTLRFVVFTGGGMLLDTIAPGAGTALSFTDTFLLEEMLNGWKPNQFVDGNLKQTLPLKK